MVKVYCKKKSLTVTTEVITITQLTLVIVAVTYLMLCNVRQKREQTLKKMLVFSMDTVSL